MKDYPVGTIVCIGGESPFFGIVINVDVWEKEATCGNTIYRNLFKREQDIPIRVLGTIVTSEESVYRSYDSDRQEVEEPKTDIIRRYAFEGPGSISFKFDFTEDRFKYFIDYLTLFDNMNWLPGYMASVLGDLQRISEYYDLVAKERESDKCTLLVEPFTQFLRVALCQ